MSPTATSPSTLSDLSSFRGRHFFTDQDYTKAELLDLLGALSRLESPLQAPGGSRPSSPGVAWR